MNIVPVLHNVKPPLFVKKYNMKPVLLDPVLSRRSMHPHVAFPLVSPRVNNMEI